jgi:hypothetical protein
VGGVVGGTHEYLLKSDMTSDHSIRRILGLGGTRCAPAGTPFLAPLERPALIMLEEGESEIEVRGTVRSSPGVVYFHVSQVLPEF